MFFRWWMGCGSKQSGLMNLLEAQNTLVPIINPPVLTLSSRIRLIRALCVYSNAYQMILLSRTEKLRIRGRQMTA